MANWADFQTALHFVAGLNVALWGIPELRAPGITNEKRKEAELLSFATSIGRFADAVTYQNRFDQNWGSLSMLFRHVSLFCLMIAIVDTFILLQASGSRANIAASEEVAWLFIGLGLLPAVVFGVLNILAKTYRAASLAMREEMAGELQAALQATAPN